jgi:hypothetical protein
VTRVQIAALPCGGPPSLGFASLRGRFAALLTALLLVASGAIAASEDAAPPCLARAQVVPPEGFPGQQLVWRLEILRRPFTAGVEWLEPPSFPGFRAEWLPGQPELAVTLDGVEYVARVEERALFPERTGELVIAGARLRCAVGGRPPQEVSAPATRVRVSALPEAGRPADFSGLVGALAVEIAAKPSRLAIGASTRLEVSLRGSGNLWDARDPLTGAPGLEGIELFPARPRLELEPGVQLAVRRSFAYDAVPSREGRLVIPTLRIPWFDPEQRVYRIATSPELALEVGPRPPEPGAPRARATEPEGVPAGPRALPLLALGALAAAGLLAWTLRRRRRGGRRAAVLAGLADAGGDEPARLARALRLSLEPRISGARSAPVEELRAPPGAEPAVEDALALLAQIERSRFDPHAPPVPRERVSEAIRALER